VYISANFYQILSTRSNAIKQKPSGPVIMPHRVMTSRRRKKITR